MAIYAVNYDGLRKRDTYNELIDYLQFKQEKIIYPDRFAKRLRESPQISNLLDGEGLGKGDLEEQEKNRIKEVLKEVAIIQTGGTAQFSRADPANNRSNINTGNAPNHDEQFQDTGEHVSETIFENNQNRQNRNQNTAERNKENLRNVHTQTNASLFGAHNLIPPAPTIPPPEPPRAGSSTDPIPTRPRFDNILEGHDVTEKSRDYYNRIHNPTMEFKENFRKKIIKQQKGERNKDLQNKRETSPPSQHMPIGQYDSKLKGKYNKRLSESMAKRNPSVPKQKQPQTQMQDRKEQLEQKRESATKQIKTKRKVLEVMDQNFEGGRGPAPTFGSKRPQTRISRAYAGMPRRTFFEGID